MQSAIVDLRGKGWSLVSIAEELGVFRTAIDKWVAGDRYPRNARGIHVMLDQLQHRSPRRPTVPYRATTKPAPQVTTTAVAVAEPPSAVATESDPVLSMLPAPDLRPASFDDLQRLLDETALLVFG